MNSNRTTAAPRHTMPSAIPSPIKQRPASASFRIPAHRRFSSIRSHRPVTLGVRLGMVSNQSLMVSEHPVMHQDSPVMLSAHGLMLSEHQLLVSEWPLLVKHFNLLDQQRALRGQQRSSRRHQRAFQGHQRPFLARLLKRHANSCSFVFHRSSTLHRHV